MEAADGRSAIVWKRGSGAPALPDWSLAPVGAPPCRALRGLALVATATCVSTELGDVARFDDPRRPDGLLCFELLPSALSSSASAPAGRRRGEPREWRRRAACRRGPGVIDLPSARVGRSRLAAAEGPGASRSATPHGRRRNGLCRRYGETRRARRAADRRHDRDRPRVVGVCAAIAETRAGRRRLMRCDGTSASARDRSIADDDPRVRKLEQRLEARSAARDSWSIHSRRHRPTLAARSLSEKWRIGGGVCANWISLL